MPCSSSPTRPAQLCRLFGPARLRRCDTRAAERGVARACDPPSATRDSESRAVRQSSRIRSAVTDRPDRPICYAAPMRLRADTGVRQRLCRKLGSSASKAARRPTAGPPPPGTTICTARRSGRRGLAPSRRERIRQPTFGPRAQRQHAVGWQGEPSARRRTPGPIPPRRSRCPPHVRRGGVEGAGASPAESHGQRCRLWLVSVRGLINPCGHFCLRLLRVNLLTACCDP